LRWRCGTAKTRILKSDVWTHDPEGNHSEDVKEVTSTSTPHPPTLTSRLSIKYPQADSRTRRSARRTAVAAGANPSLSLPNGVFDGDRYWDVTAEYAKASPDTS